MATLAEIAKLAGVGVMSVSRVVTGKRRVSPEVERRVRAAIEQLGYVPNEAARVLKGNRSSVIGLIVPDLADPFFAELGNAVQQTAWNAGYMTLMAASDHRENLEISETELMVQRRVAGLLAVAIGTKNAHFAQAQRSGVPVVAIDRPMEHVSTDTLTVDNYDAAYLATQHLIEHGHNKVLCIADDEQIYTRLQRVAGYKKAVTDAGLLSSVCLTGQKSGTLERHLNSALASVTGCTAIFAASNLVAVAVLRDLQRRNLRIPEDVALVCFDDFSAATLMNPMVSVIQQPVAEIGRQAASMLFQRLKSLQSSEQEKPEHIVLPTRLLIRGSCGEHEGKRHRAGAQRSSQTAAIVI